MAELHRLENGVVTDRFVIDRPEYVIGRADDADICVEDSVVSARHCIIESVSDPDREGILQYFVKDLGSTNETFVNDSPVQRQRLHTNDVIRIGWFFFKFFDKNEPTFEKTKKIRKSWIPGIFYTK